MYDKIESVIFDMDGTIIDSSAVISGAINHVRYKLGLPPLSKDKILTAVNDMHIHSPSYFYEVDEFDTHHIEWFQDYYSKHYAYETRVYEGIRELLEELKKCTRLALATNAYRVSTMQIIRHLDLEDYFDLIVCADDVPHSKPNPDMILKILNEFNVSPKNALVVGDSLKDKEAASRAGVKTILVDWGFSNLDAAIKDVKELKKLLLSNSCN